MCAVQNVIVFRARVPWNKDLGIAQGLSEVFVERGEKIVCMMYNLKDDVVSAAACCCNGVDVSLLKRLSC